MKLDIRCAHPKCDVTTQLEYSPGIFASVDKICAALRDKGWVITDDKSAICSIHRVAPEPEKAPISANYVPILAQRWIESERGCGSRPDGVTLHLTDSDRIAYIAQYNRLCNSEPEVPDEYTRAEGAPFWIMLSDQCDAYKYFSTRTNQCWVKSVEQSKTGEWIVTLYPS